MKVLEITKDHEAKAIYILVSHNEVQSSKMLSNNVLIDLDQDGDLIGIEVLDVDFSGDDND